MEILKRVVTTANNETRYITFLIYRNTTFRVTYHNQSYYPNGLDVRFCAEMLTSQGWKNLVTKHDIGFNPIHRKTDKDEIFIDSEKFLNLMQEHIKLIYR